MPTATLAARPDFGGMFLLLAYILALSGALAAHLARARARETRGPARLGWAAGTGLALGGGTIWSAQVVTVIGRGPGAGVSFSPVGAVVSLIAAVGGVVAGVALLRPDPLDGRRLVVAAIVTGAGAWLSGVAGPQPVVFSLADGRHVVPTAISPALSMVAAGVSLWVLFHARGVATGAVAVAISAAAWSGAQLAAASSLRFAADATGRANLESDGFGVGLVVAVATAIVLIFLVFAAATRSDLGHNWTGTTASVIQNAHRASVSERRQHPDLL